MSEIRISNIPVISESAGVTTLTANNLTGNLTGTVTNLSKSLTALDTSASNGATSNADNTALPLFGCRAFVNFNGTSYTSVGGENHCAIRSSGNVSKVVRKGTGDYEVHFVTVMPDVNYCINCTAGRTQDTTNAMRVGVIKGPPDENYVRVATCYSDNSTSDANECCVTIFR